MIQSESIDSADDICWHLIYWRNVCIQPNERNIYPTIKKHQYRICYISYMYISWYAIVIAGQKPNFANNQVAASKVVSRVHQNIKKFSEFHSHLIYVVSIWMTTKNAKKNDFWEKACRITTTPNPKSQAESILQCLAWVWATDCFGNHQKKRITPAHFNWLPLKPLWVPIS